MLNSKQWLLALWLAMCMAPLVSLPAQAKPVAVPAFSARLLDLTGTLDEGQKETLREKIASLEENTGAVLAVLMLQTTGEETMEEYATRVFDQWKLGDAEQDNGLLLIVALKDRRTRIEVGQGLEGTVPDVLAGRIIDQDMAPRFRGKDYAGGIEAAITSLEALLRAEPQGQPAEFPDPQEAGWRPSTLSAWGLVAAAVGAGCALSVFVALGMRAVWRRNRWEFGVRAGLVMAITGWAWLESMPDDSLWSWMPAAAAAGISLLFCFLFPDAGSRGGSSGGGSSGGSSGNSGSSGGGSSSGGGASGSW